MRDLPAGTVTFLFTDIEGSTRLWEQYPDAMRQALARHDRVAADLIARHEGTLLKSRGEGDSLFAVFSHASQALAAACALQQAFLDFVLATEDTESTERDREFEKDDKERGSPRHGRRWGRSFLRPRGRRGGR